MDSGIHKLLMKKAGALLARRAYSSLELHKKLAPFADDEQVASTIRQLERLNLLNDLDFAYNFALRHIRQLGWSQTRARNALIGHQVEPSIIERALERVRGESGSEEPVIRQYVTKRYGKIGMPSDPKGIRKLIMHLRQRGFEEENIIGALKGIIPDAVLQRFQTGE